MNKDFPWRFFNEACMGIGNTYALGFVLYLLNNYYFMSKASFGATTNTVGEFNALYYLLKFGVDKNIA